MAHLEGRPSEIGDLPPMASLSAPTEIGRDCHLGPVSATLMRAMRCRGPNWERFRAFSADVGIVLRLSAIPSGDYGLSALLLEGSGAAVMALSSVVAGLSLGAIMAFAVIGLRLRNSVIAGLSALASRRGRHVAIAVIVSIFMLRF